MSRSVPAMNDTTNSNYPVFGICGYSGSGKSTVIESVVQTLVGRGLKVAVVKHDVHGLNIDKEGKDTDRFFRAGADAIIRGPKQAFLRAHRRGDLPLQKLIRQIGPFYDLVIAEGHKTTPIRDMVWLCTDEGEAPPEGTTVQRILRRDEDRVHIVMDMIDAWLPGAWQSGPVYAGIMVGGNNSRIDRSKRLICGNANARLRQMVEQIRPHVDGIALLGAGVASDDALPLPVLCDVQDAQGPQAGMLAAMRWRPLTSWVFVPCDLPHISDDSVRWLLSHRRPGTWAVLPRLPEAPMPEPLPAYCDFRAAPLLESASRPIELAESSNTVTPVVPKHILESWTNVNTPGDPVTDCSSDTAARIPAKQEGGRP